MLLNDNEHLPRIVTEINGIADVLLAIEPEIIQLRQDISDVLKELYVKTTDNLIARWEKDFSLPYDSSLTLQQRRQRVLNKMARKKPLTWTNLRLLIKNNLAENVQFYIVNDAPNFSFKILVGTNNYSEMERAVSEAKPAYLLFSVNYNDFNTRYCGTFYAGTNPL